MITYLLRKLVIGLIPTLIGISIITFIAIHLIPGTYVDVLVGTSDLTQEQLLTLNHTYGLDKPLPVQYWYWIRNVATGDFGNSLTTRIPVTEEIASRFLVTVELSVLSVLFSVCLAIPIGMISAIKNNTLIDMLGRIVGLIGLSIPNFLVGTFLILFVSKYFPILPIVGFVPLKDGLFLNLKTMILPTFTLGLFMVASTMRMTRSSVIEELKKEYVIVVKAKGVRQRIVYLSHVLRNSLIPVVTNIAIQTGYLLGGTIIVEELFALPGIGRLAYSAVESRDYPVVQGVVLFMAVSFVVVNLIADISYGYLDPRIRKS